MEKFVITDMGNPVTLTSDIGETMTIARYGVWRLQKPNVLDEVVEVGEDLQVLAQKYGVDPEDVVPWRAS